MPSADARASSWGLSRFTEEARMLAQFEHPNAVRVRDCFEGQQHRLPRDAPRGRRTARCVAAPRDAHRGVAEAGGATVGGRSAAGSRGGLPAPGHQARQAGTRISLWTPRGRRLAAGLGPPPTLSRAFDGRGLAVPVGDGGSLLAATGRYAILYAWACVEVWLPKPC